jgi:hypothetical protein
LVVAALVAAGLVSGCALRSAHPKDYGIQPCPGDAANALLSPDALQCWFVAPHGRWRILSHVSFNAALVVDIETTDLRDADDIARRFAAHESAGFLEILVYAQTEVPSPTVRRVRWTRENGFDALQFRGSPRP